MAKNTVDLSLEEYKTLRTEILRNFDAMERNMIACITANGVALAYGIKESQPIVLFIALLIPVYFWIQHASHRNSAAKLAAYIATFIESKHTNLMWEQRVQQVDSQNNGIRISYLLRTFVLPYPVLVSVSTLVILLHITPIGTSYALTLLRACLLFLIVWLISKKADVPYAKLRKPWIDAFLKIKAKEAMALPDNNVH